MNSFPESLSSDHLIGPALPVGTNEVRAILISTVNGSSTVQGTTGQMGNETDRTLFLDLRQWADIVVVGAETARAEQYGAVHTSPENSQRRLERGQSATPPLAIVSRSLEFDTPADFVLAPQSSVAAPELEARRTELLDAGTQLISTGSGSAQDIISSLHTRGFHRVDAEGGPAIFGILWDADLIDVMHLTMEPIASAPVEKPLFSTHPGTDGFSRRLNLEQAEPTSDGTVFLRYRRER